MFLIAIVAPCMNFTAENPNPFWEESMREEALRANIRDMERQAEQLALSSLSKDAERIEREWGLRLSSKDLAEKKAQANVLIVKQPEASDDAKVDQE